MVQACKAFALWSDHLHVMGGLTTFAERTWHQSALAGDPSNISSIVLVTEDEFYLKSDAILRIGKSLQAPFSLLTPLGFVLPKGLRDALYDQVRGMQWPCTATSCVLMCWSLQEQVKGRCPFIRQFDWH